MVTPFTEEFIPKFDSFSGERFAGAPLSEVRLNYAQQRIEQFFENVGFYRNFSDAPGTVQLLSYGAAACDKKCNYSPKLEALLIRAAKAADDQPFLPQLGRIGGATVFGEPLTQPYIAPDGAQEQVYANAVLYSPAGKSETVRLRPLPRLLNMLSSEPGVQTYGNQNGVVFYPVNGNLGYHVPLIFDEFIADHGGLEISGNPIAETIEYEPGLYRQCFENYCLDYRPSASEDLRLSIAPLGSAYLNQIQGNQTQTQPLVVSPETVEIHVSEQYKQLPANSPQKIDILVFKKNDQQPLAGFESDLTINLPDGSAYEAAIPETQNDGRASVIVPGMNNIKNGSILTYTVCLKAATSQPVCAGGSYLIWNTP